MPALLQPIAVRGVGFRNRIVISPMQQYAGTPDGRPTEWHHQHLERYALAGAGLVIVEALAVCPAARLTWSDIGAWEDGQTAPLARLAEAITAHGSVAGAQLNHAGRKGSVQRPWHGFEPMGADDVRLRGEHPWETMSASAIPANPGWPTPRAATRDDIARSLEQFAAAARRVREAGFRVLNIHGAHGYLIHAFLSPLANTREDAYGGSLENRMRYALEVADAVRSEWPGDRPLFYRLSCVDDAEGGWSLDDTVALARAFARRGVDVVDCSSGGLQRRTTTAVVPRVDGYQVPYAERVRRDAGLATMAVGLIRDPRHADAIVAEGRADFVAIGREALFNPHWPMQAAVALRGPEAFDAWPPAYGWWLKMRSRTLAVSKAAAE
ncbi:MAG: NADH:flavin oxidoreductase/NADH oxidase [Alphaproteobacteria bacterium]|nr:NADH:flavin oxidoreductase/NADH oxidase [Alphaproteobacteria bacterium]